MADLDTREKRASALQFIWRGLPLPDGTISGADRAQTSRIYSGIAPAAPALTVQRRTITGADLLDLEVLQRQETVRWELLDASLSPIGDLHPFLGASVDVNTESTYFRALRNLTLLASEAADIDTYASRVKPYWVLETGDEYPLGVFMFQARDRPQRTYGGPTVCPLLVDQTWILDATRRYSYAIAVGALLSDHLKVLATEAGVADVTSIENSAIVASDDIFWPAGSRTRLQMMTELCALLAFHPPYFNNDGKLICRSVPNLDLATPDHRYPLGDVSRLLVDTAVESDDAWNAPNIYVVVNTSATQTPIVGSYEIPSDAPNSVLNSGREVVRTINEPGAQDDAQAAAMAKAAYAQTAGAFRWVEFDATPDPRHDIFDIVEYDSLNFREPAWSLACAPGGPHHHSLRRIYVAA